MVKQRLVIPTGMAGRFGASAPAAQGTAPNTTPRRPLVT
jgi:hypothetical protein